MISKVFSGKSTYAYVLFVAMAAVVFYGLGFRLIDYAENKAYFLGNDLLQWLNFTLSVYDFLTIGFAVYLLQTIGVTALSTRYSLLQDENLLPSFIYLLLIAQAPDLMLRPDVVLAFLFIHFSYFFLLNFVSPETVLMQIFPFGFLLGIAFLFHPETIFFIFLAPILIIAQRRRLSINELLAYIMGVVAPIYFYGVIYFLVNDQINGLLKQIDVYFSDVNPIIFHWSNYLLVLINLFVLFALFHVYYFRVKRMKVNVRMTYQNMVFLVVFVSLAYFIFPFSSEIMWGYLLLPLSFFISFVFLEMKQKWILDLLLLLFIMLQLMQLYQFSLRLT